MSINNPQDDNNIDKYLAQRGFEAHSLNLANKIQSNALQIKQKEKPFFSRVLDEITEIRSLLLIPRPALACALLIALGVFLGNDIFSGDDVLNTLEEYFYYQGALI